MIKSIFYLFILLYSLEIFLKFIFILYKSKKKEFKINFFSLFILKKFFFGRITFYPDWMIETIHGKIDNGILTNKFRFAAAKKYLNLSEEENLSILSQANRISLDEVKLIFSKNNAFEQLRYRPFFGLFNLPNQNLPYAKLNNLGIQMNSKDFEKKENAKRVLILGGSTALGFGASESKFNISNSLEKILNEMEIKNNKNSVIKWEVINLAFMASQTISDLNVLIVYASALKPDYVFHLSGYNDLFYYMHVNKDKRLFRFNGSDEIYSELYKSNLSKLILFLSEYFVIVKLLKKFFIKHSEFNKQQIYTIY